jgi:molecular chaperone DnaK (HSP70)
MTKTNPGFRKEFRQIPFRTKLVIGIDFGTTFTGVAYAHSSVDVAKNTSSLNPEQIRDKITVIKSWPKARHCYTDKTATTLAYENGEVIAWGGRVRRSHSVTVSYFKLGLQEGANEHYLSKENKPALSSLNGYLGDSNWKHPDLPNKEPIDLAADYLKEVRQYVVNEVLPNEFGATFLENQRLKYVLTVPAIWSDKARDLTKRAAIRAGIPEEELELITEPEAAALYCSTLCHETDLKDGDRFLVCDAGGGTVVITPYFIAGGNTLGFDLL